MELEKATSFTVLVHDRCLRSPNSRSIRSERPVLESPAGGEAGPASRAVPRCLCDSHAPQEGATGETVMQAYVEIVFDNRDGRIPVRPQSEAFEWLTVAD